MTTGLLDSASTCPSPSSYLVNSRTSFLTRGDMETRGRGRASGGQRQGLWTLSGPGWPRVSDTQEDWREAS